MGKEREEIIVVAGAIAAPSFKSTEPAIVDAPPGVLAVAQVSMTPEDKAKRKAFFVTALERGIIHDRLHVDLPPDVHGEWVRSDKFEIDRMKHFGFAVDTVYAPSQSLHSDGTKVAQVADVIFMTCTKDNKAILDEVKHERFLAQHAKRGSNTAREEQDFANQVKAHGDIIPIVESKTREANRDDVAAAVAAMNMQTKS